MKALILLHWDLVTIGNKFPHWYRWRITSFIVILLEKLSQPFTSYLKSEGSNSRWHRPTIQSATTLLLVLLCFNKKNARLGLSRLYCWQYCQRYGWFCKTRKIEIRVLRTFSFNFRFTTRRNRKVNAFQPKKNFENQFINSKANINYVGGGEVKWGWIVLTYAYSLVRLAIGQKSWRI